MGSFVLALRGRPSWKAYDGHGPSGGKIDLHGTDGTATQLVERCGIVAEQLAWCPVCADCLGEHVMGIAAVLVALVGAGAHVVPGRVVNELIDG